MTLRTRGPGSAALIALALAVTACGCVLGDGGSRAADAVPAVRAARVRGIFQDRMTAALAAAPTATDAYGLFSEGGWSDEGQVAVLAGAAGTARLYVAAHNKNDWTVVDRDLAATDAAPLLALVKTADALPDVDVKSLDALEFEYAHAHREADGRVTVVARVFIRNPGTKPTPDHEALVTAFLALRDKALP